MSNKIDYSEDVGYYHLTMVWVSTLTLPLKKVFLNTYQNIHFNHDLPLPNHVGRSVTPLLNF